MTAGSSALEAAARAASNKCKQKRVKIAMVTRIMEGEGNGGAVGRGTQCAGDQAR